MSTSSTQNGLTPNQAWSTVAPYLIAPAAASVAIVPTFYGFVAKTALQMGKPAPIMSVKECLVRGLKASPTIGSIVGTQMAVQSLVETQMRYYFAKEGRPPPDWVAMMVSTLFVGGASAPLLAVFNGQSSGLTIKQSVKALSAKQTLAVVSRETFFLFSLRLSEPVSESMKTHFGDNRVVKVVSAFVTGVVGSLAGHTADTALTLWQNKMQVTSFSQLMRGFHVRGLTVGTFTALYTVAKETFQAMK